MSELEEMAQKLIEGNESKVRELVSQALARGIPAREILDKGLVSGMNEVGKRFREADMFIPEVLLAAKAMNAGTAILKPVLQSGSFQQMGTVVLGTVKGDVHEIGKNLVGIMLSGAGFEVIDIGVGVLPQKFIETAVEKKARLICMSALLTVTMPSLRDTISELKKAGLGTQIKTMVGGATVTQRYADGIGADGYAPDAGSAVLKAKELLKLK